MKYIALIFVGLLLCIPISAQVMDSPYIEAVLAYQDPDPVEPGETVELRFSIKNTGASTAKSTEFKIMPEYPFELANEEDEIKEVGDVPVYDAEEIITGEATVTYKILVDKDVMDGEYDLQIAYRTEGGLSRGNWIEFDTFKIKVGGKATNVVIEKIETSPEKVSPGQEVEVTLTVANNGNSIVEDMTITLNLEDTAAISPLKTSSQAVISQISARQTQDVVFDVIITPDAEIKVYEIPVTMSYSDQRNNEYEKTTYIAIPVDAEPEYVLNMEETEVYTEGQSGEITVSLSNIGVSNINYATLSILPSNDYIILSSDTVYIGNLESDDYETAQFKIYTQDYKEELPVLFRLIYKDNYNRNYDDEITLSMNMFSSWKAKKYGLVQGSSAWTIIILVILVGAGSWYWWKYKKVKKEKKG
jgi:hypothetical protein